MATSGWGTKHSVATMLFDEGHRFDFFQAVRLLELLHSDRAAVGEGVEPDKEVVRFKSKISLAFPATDVESIQAPPGRPTPAEMTVNFLGLAGGLGPLPPHYTEMILERVWRQDTALRDFLDVFNHRLVSLFYRARKKHYFDHGNVSPEKGALAQHLYALLGLGTTGLRGRLPVRDRALLRYVGLLARQPRSMIGLTALLADYFGVPVTGQQCCGRWQALEADQVTRLGVSGQNQRLGDGTVLGTRVWDQQGQFVLTLGPLTWQRWLDLLPTGRCFDALCALTRFYAGDLLDWKFRLRLRASEAPPARLSGAHGPRLGWTSWLSTRPGTEDRQVCLTPRRPSRELPTLVAVPQPSQTLKEAA